jgi:hypothetical protein
MSNASTAYHLNVHVAPKDIQALKQSGYKMYIAKKCNNTYNVVWAGQSFLQNNDFTWVDKYKVFAVDTFADGEVVKISSTAAVDITPGQTAVLDSNGILSSAQGVVKKTGAFMIENDYGAIHLAVACKFHGEYTPFFVTPNPVMSGLVKLTPIENIIIWFATELKVSSMFMEAATNSFEIEYDSSQTNKVISYYSPPGGNPGNGQWAVGPLPSNVS